MDRDNINSLAGFYGARMKYWNNAKLEREDAFSCTGPNSSDEEYGWRRAIDLEKARRESKGLKP